MILDFIDKIVVSRIGEFERVRPSKENHTFIKCDFPNFITADNEVMKSKYKGYDLKTRQLIDLYKVDERFDEAGYNDDLKRYDEARSHYRRIYQLEYDKEVEKIGKDKVELVEKLASTLYDYIDGDVIKDIQEDIEKDFLKIVKEC